jgi:phage shock protein PspC (stress-responsive transcriptional regulator)
MNDEDKTPRPEPEPEEPGTAETEEMRDRTREVGPSPPPAVEPGRRRFLRSKDDRVLAGVAGGLGGYFNIDPIIIRIAFAVSVLFGGLGVIAYLAVAIFVPADDGAGNPVPSSRSRDVFRVVAAVALIALAFGGFGLLTALAFVATGLGFGLPVAIIVVIIGIALAALSFRGGARWLIVPALALAIGVGAAAASDVDLGGGVGSRDFRRASASSIPADGYELGVGRLAVDLRDIDWSPKRVVDLRVRVGAGQAIVAVPSDVCVVADAHAGAGDLVIAGEQADGAGVDLRTAEGARATPRLELDADVDLGQFVVLNNDDAAITRDSWDHEYHGDRPVARAANDRARGR